ncbi:hypothetical protein D6827_00625 [Candidatus Parcubacteria bacterium]|nr:MAG: hypothetical protein D6827_00625 [Candidatus Parcubacteria bacterium]
MKSKEEILEMSIEELEKYKWNEDFDRVGEFDDANYDCLRCTACHDCERDANASQAELASNPWVVY